MQSCVHLYPVSPTRDGANSILHPTRLRFNSRMRQIRLRQSSARDCARRRKRLLRSDARMEILARCAMRQRPSLRSSVPMRGMFIAPFTRDRVSRAIYLTGNSLQSPCFGRGCQSEFIFFQTSDVSSRSFLHPSRFSIHMTTNHPLIAAAIITISEINLSSLYVIIVPSPAAYFYSFFGVWPTRHNTRDTWD